MSEQNFSTLTVSQVGPSKMEASKLSHRFFKKNLLANLVVVVVVVFNVDGVRFVMSLIRSFLAFKCFFYFVNGVSDMYIVSTQ